MFKQSRESGVARSAAAWGAILLSCALSGGCSGGGGGGISPFGDGGGGGSDSPPVGQELAMGTVLSSTAVTPAMGALLAVASEDPELDGTTLVVPPNSVAGSLTLSIGTPAELPGTASIGDIPAGKAFVIEPTGTLFDAANQPTLTLPIPTGDVGADLYVGRWNPAISSWEDIGGEVSGDYISVELEHLSAYGVFYAGKSYVRIKNDAASPPADLGIEIYYLNGPVAPPSFTDGLPFPAYPPLPAGGLEIDPGHSGFMKLLPGHYNFMVSYPHPQPGISNVLSFAIPELTSGADDGTIDQVLTITLDGASSTDLLTDASIVFPGANDNGAANVRPVVNVTAEAPAGVPVIDATTGGAVTPATHIVAIGPIVTTQLQVPNALKLIGRATDSDSASLHICWTWSEGTLPSHYSPIASGATMDKYFRPNPLRAGVYTVHYTAYDQFGLFDQGSWVITVRGNTVPRLEVIADDFVIDFGRLDEKRRPIGAFVSVPGFPVYTYTGGVIGLRQLPLVGLPSNPDQDPTGMTVVFALVSDADGDPLATGFVIPEPMFGRGNFYAAIPVPPTAGFPAGLAVGDIIDNYAKMDAYNLELSFQANAGNLPVDATIFPGRPAGTQALPILWEAPDDPDVPSNTTNDCSEFAGCQIANGGTVVIEGRTTDGFSAQRRDFGMVAFPDDAGTGNFQLISVVPNPPDPGPGQPVTVVATIFPPVAGVTVEFSIVGTDGYNNSSAPTTDDNGQASFYIPGGAEGVVDVVTVRCGGSEVVVTYIF